MYAFLIVITIMMPTLKPTKEIAPPTIFSFRVFPSDNMAPETCQSKAKELTEWTMDLMKRRMPYARAQAEVNCTLNDLRKI